MKLANGPELEDFPYERGIHHWNNQKKRRLARIYQPLKPKDSDSVLIE